MRAPRLPQLALVSSLFVVLSLAACDSAVEPKSSLAAGPRRNAQISTTNFPVTVLPDLGAGGGMVMSIDSPGHAGGQAFTQAQSGFPRAILWVNGQLIDLGMPSGWSGTAVAINDDHVIIGIMSGPAGELHSFRWIAGVLTDLGTFGGEASFVMDINS